MDLREKAIPSSEIEKVHSFILSEKLSYQPFIFSEDLEVGEGLAISSGISNLSTRSVLHWPSAPASLKDLLVPPDQFSEFREANQNLRTVYDGFVDFILANVARHEKKDFLEFGCNTGYFVHRLSERGARRAIGMDLTREDEIFAWFNRVLGTSSEFILAEWDCRLHTVRFNRMPEADVLMSIAVICHLPDPLQHLTFLCEHAREAIFVWAPVRPEEELLMSFGPPSLLPGTTLSWPLSFDHLVRPSRQLVQLCLRECGFEDMIDLPQICGLNPWWQDCLRHHCGILAFRTGTPKTMYSGGRKRKPLPHDFASRSLDEQWPLDPEDPPRLVFRGVSHGIVYYRGFFHAIPVELGDTDLATVDDPEAAGIIREENLEVLFERIPPTRPVENRP